MDEHEAAERWIASQLFASYVKPRTMLGVAFKLIGILWDKMPPFLEIQPEVRNLWRHVFENPFDSIDLDIERVYPRNDAEGTAQLEQLLEKTGVLVVDPLKVFYRTEQAGALATNLIQGALIDPERLPGLQPEDVQILRLSDSQELDPYTIVVKTAGETLPQEEIWKQNHVAIVTLSPQMTLAQFVQEALAQWTGRSVGEILQIEHKDGRFRIYA